MDLSKLSSNLPLSSAPTDESINKLNKELSDEFKIGARSIAALYRLSNSKNSLLIAKGYLDCINEISNYLENGNISSLSDLNNFLISKKSEFNNNSDTLTNNNSNNITDSNTIIQNNENNENILNDSFKFSINNPTTHHFPKTNIPISIDHKNLKYYHNKSKFNNNTNNNNNNNSKFNLKSKSSNILSSSDEEVIADDDNEDSKLSSERGNSITNINNSNILNTQLNKFQINNDNNNNDNNTDISFDDSNPNHKRKILDNSISLKKTKRNT